MKYKELKKYSKSSVQVDFLDHALTGNDDKLPLIRVYGHVLEVKKKRLIMTWWWYPRKKDKHCREVRNLERMVISNDCIKKVKVIK